MFTIWVNCSFFYLEDLVFVRFKAMELELEVPKVPEGNSLVSAASGKDELRVGVETQAVDLNKVIF